MPQAVLLTVEGGKSMEQVTEAMGSVIEFAGSILTTITGNPILLFIFAAGLVPIGFRVLRGLKGTAKS